MRQLTVELDSNTEISLFINNTLRLTKTADQMHFKGQKREIILPLAAMPLILRPSSYAEALCKGELYSLRIKMACLDLI